VFAESAKLLYQEIDYQNEAKNAIRFREQVPYTLNPKPKPSTLNPQP